MKTRWNWTIRGCLRLCNADKTKHFTQSLLINNKTVFSGEWVLVISEDRDSHEVLIPPTARKETHLPAGGCFDCNHLRGQSINRHVNNWSGATTVTTVYRKSFNNRSSLHRNLTAVFFVNIRERKYFTTSERPALYLLAVCVTVCLLALCTLIYWSRSCSALLQCTVRSYGPSLCFAAFSTHAFITWTRSVILFIQPLSSSNQPVVIHLAVWLHLPDEQRSM